MNKTEIEWTNYTWNPVTGCLNGCKYCYARGIAARWYPPEIGFSPHFYPERLNQPLKVKKPQKIFTVDMGDLFGPWVPQDWIDAVLETVRKCPQHSFQFLTKFPKRLPAIEWPANAWIGVTATDQKMFDEAVQHLKAAPLARVKFISAEPLLGPIRIKNPGLDWLIIGAQSKPVIMPKRGWIDDLITDAREADIAVFIKEAPIPLGYQIQEWPDKKRSPSSACWGRKELKISWTKRLYRNQIRK